MNELVYVLAVEALIFGALCTVLVAQRVDVFTWPADRTWPVLTSSLQVLLLNAHALLLVCCFIAAGRYSSFAPDVHDACARSSGRLATAAVLAAAYVAALLALRGHVTECVLCQLLDTTCMEPAQIGGLALSHAAYLAVLIPVAALQAGLVVAASGLCKESRVVPRRVATVNCALLLAMQAQKTLDHNASRLPTRCSPSAATSPDTSPHVIILLMVLYALDSTADLFAYVVLNGRGGFHLPVLFSACRVASLAAPWSLHPLLDDGVLPFKLLLSHSALALLLALLDIGDVWLAHFATTASRTTHTPAPSAPAVALQHPPETTPTQQAHAFGSVAFGSVAKPAAAFEVDPGRRRRFVLAFNNKARWPSQQTAKKTA
jgi:hypothetical protein